MTNEEAMDSKRIGIRLKRLRMRAGLRQRDVAERMASHRPIVCRIESGRTILTIETIGRYCNAVGAQLFEVFT